MLKNSILLFVLIIAVFFYKSVFFGLIPFPGELLVSEYNPWKTYSYLGYAPGAYPNKAQNIDVIRELYPWKTVAIQSLKDWQIPLWNPYSFSGAPLMANFQSAVLYPLNVFYFLFDQKYAWSLLVFTQSFLTLFFTYLYATKIGLSKFGAYMTSISFTFSYFLSVWIEYNTIGHIILWLPLALLSLEHLLAKFSLRWSIFFVFSLVSSLLAGHPQVFTYLFVFVFVYFIFRLMSYKNKLEKIYYIVPLQFISIGICGIQVLPGFELIKESARSPHDYQFLVNKILIQPMQLVMIIVPDLFGNPATRNYWLGDTYIGKVISIGTIPLLFILYSIIHKKESLEKFFLTVSIGILLIATNNPLTRALYAFNIPMISSSAPTLAIFILSFSLSIIAGFGFDKFRNSSNSLRRLIIWILPVGIIYIIVLLFALGLGEHKSIALRNFTYNAIILFLGISLVVISSFRKQLLVVILVFLLIIHSFDLWRSFNKFNPFSDKTLVFPANEIFTFLKENAGINRFWGYGAAAIEANYSAQYFIYSPDGSDPLYPRWYGQFIHASVDGKLPTQFTRFNRSDAVIAPGYGEKDLSNNLDRLRVIDVLGVKYVLDRIENASTQKTFTPSRFRLIHEENGWKIFENLNSLPRAFLSSDYKVFSSPKEFEKIFFASDFNPSKTILLEENIKDSSFLDGKNVTNVDIEIPTLISYKPNRVSFKTNTSNNKLLFLSDTHYPGWKAFVDDKETKLYRADYAFRAVLVPKGDHRIDFVYKPDSFFRGIVLTIFSIVILCVFLALFYKRKSYLKNKKI